MLILACLMIVVWEFKCAGEIILRYSTSMGEFMTRAPMHEVFRVITHIRMATLALGLASILSVMR